MRRKTLTLSTCACLLASTPAWAQMTMPTDAEATCTADIASWFGGTVTPNGVVSPPSSVTFTDDNPNGGAGPQICNFYQWGSQMFLWLTSPEGDGIVLDGAAIYNVLPEVDGVRRFQKATATPALNVALRAEKAVDSLGEVTQAGGGTLMSQGKSLVYYGVHSNDVYADFLTLQKNTKAEDLKDFPISADELKLIEAYVEKVGLDAPVAPETLAMELKTSWVDAATLPDASAYVTMPAVVPAYTPNANNTVWTPNGTQDLTLALVGIHVVGTVQDHPEFVWATFEHINNAPDVGYYYSNGGTEPVQWPYDSSGSYTFLATDSTATGKNVECMTTTANKDNPNVIEIVAEMKDGGPVCAGGIVPSDTVRVRPWGSLPYTPDDVNSGKITQDVFDKAVKNNTELVSLNTNVLSQIAAGDPRKNYVQTGGIWTTTPQGGGPAPIPNQNGDETAQMRGSLDLYNATMETYSQTFANSCFFCHNVTQGETNSFGKFQLSHIYYQLKPLVDE
ncbi:hypothetical protein [uncultured Tateyamaria sp.]|uniref:hypothetical protein n=1 Tax=Tateyamaria sp. 1078 TaxID=3417464 RepID=UPI00262D8929|nr:hypothetical protein [uncultured Tateyamaria sp.]